MYLIIKQAYDVGLFPAVPMLVSYDAPARPEFWKTLGDKGTFATFIVYYHPTMKLHAARRGLPQEVPGRVQGGAGLRRPQRLCPGACSSPTRSTLAKSDKGDDVVKALLANKFEGWNGTISLHARRGPVLAAVDAADAGHAVHEGRSMPFAEVKIVFPPELKTGDWMPAPKR